MPDPIVRLEIITTSTRRVVTTTLTGFEGETLYPTIQGGGDCTLAVYLGPLANSITGNPLAGVPNGYFPGVLADNLQGFSKLSGGPQFNFGSATVDNDIAVSFPTIYGMSQAPDGWGWGRWVFIAEVLSTDVFSNEMGIGWGRQYAGGTGLDPNFWLMNGQYGAFNVNGGAMIHTGGFNGFHPTFGALGQVLQVDNQSVMGVGSMFIAAIDMDPPISLYDYDPQKLIPQSMPCIPCCPVPCNGRFV